MKEQKQKRKYVKPEIQVEQLERVDILTASVAVTLKNTKKQTAFISPWASQS